MYTKAYLSLKKINFYPKLIGILLVFISIILVDNIYLVASLILLGLISSLLLRDFSSLQISIILIVVFMFYYLHPFLLVVVKLLLLYNLYLVVKKIVNIKEKKYLFDTLFYRLKGKTIDNIYIETYYKNNLFCNNMSAYDDMDKFTRRKFSNYIVKQAQLKTNYDMQDIYYRNRLSYYKFYNKKTNILEIGWNYVDSIFILITVVIFILVLITR